MQGARFVALVAASALVVFFGARQRKLQSDLHEARLRLGQPSAGQFMPTFEATDDQGRKLTIGEVPDSGHQVLLGFAQDCPYCAASIPVWRVLIDSATTWQVQVVAISFDSLSRGAAYLRRHSLRAPAVTFPVGKLAALSRIRAVPVTLVLTSTGQVMWARTGVLDEAGLDTVLRIIGPRLPTRAAMDPAR